MKLGLTRKGTPWIEIKVGLSKDEAAAQGNAWLVLRNKTRLRIIHILKRHGGLLCVSEIAEALDENPSVISGHLAILRAVKLVSQENMVHTSTIHSKKGQWSDIAISLRRYNCSPASLTAIQLLIFPSPGHA